MVVKIIGRVLFFSNWFEVIDLFFGLRDGELDDLIVVR